MLTLEIANQLFLAYHLCCYSDRGLKVDIHVILITKHAYEHVQLYIYLL